MSDMFLSEEEVQFMTGLIRPAAQVRFLCDKLGIPAYKNAANQVVVYRAWIDQFADRPDSTPPLPDFEAMSNVK